MIAIEPVATVRNSRSDLSDDDWGPVVSTIALSADLREEALEGIESVLTRPIRSASSKLSSGSDVS